MGLLVNLIRNIPMFALLLVIYHVMLAFFAQRFPNQDMLDFVLIRWKLPSEALWSLTVSDAVILAGLMFLFIELIKSTRTATGTMVEHIFSMFVFLVYLLEFLLFPLVAHSAFLILAGMSFIDVLAGFTISYNTAKRDFSVGG